MRPNCSPNKWLAITIMLFCCHWVCTLYVGSWFVYLFVWEHDGWYVQREKKHMAVEDNGWNVWQSCVYVHAYMCVGGHACVCMCILHIVRRKQLIKQWIWQVPVQKVPSTLIIIWSAIEVMESKYCNLVLNAVFTGSQWSSFKSGVTWSHFDFLR